jgi:hypothetical protein
MLRTALSATFILLVFLSLGLAPQPGAAQALNCKGKKADRDPGCDDDGGPSVDTEFCDVVFGLDRTAPVPPAPDTREYCVIDATGSLTDDDNRCVFKGFNDNTPGWNLGSDCTTNTTLEMPDGMDIFDGGEHTLHFTGKSDGGWTGWQGGTAGLTMVYARGRIANFVITADSDADHGCGTGDLETAISLNGSAPNPGGGGPFLQAVNNEIDVDGTAQFCVGIDLIGRSPIEHRGGVIRDNTFHAGSYERAAAEMAFHNYNDAQDASEGGIGGNTIHPGATCAAGIIFGPENERGGIEDNEIWVSPGDSAVGSECYGVGIAVSDSGVATTMGGTAFGRPDDIAVSGNTINNYDALSIGVVYGYPLSAKTQENVLSSGVPPSGEDIGLCVETNVDPGISTRRKRLNSFDGFATSDNEVLYTADCSNPVFP